MSPLIERVALLLAGRGPMSTRDLASALKETPTRVSESIRHTRSRGRYGISVVGKTGDKFHGGPANVWMVDKAVLERYLSLRGPYDPHNKITRLKVKSQPKPKPVQVKEPKPDYSRKVPTYTGPFRTIWQTPSPYKKETA